MRRNETLANLRTFVTLLVVAHHAALAYHQYAPPLPASLTETTAWPAFPIVDSQRWGLAALLVGINDSFFMSLMFLVSGIFAWPSLVRKGTGPYLRDRTVRLGLPFIVSAALLAPLAYYPTYLTTTAPGGVAAYVRTWIGLGQWYAGPAWFLWVLLAFGGVLAVLFARAPGVVTQAGELFGRLADRPVRWVALLVVLSAVAYLPMAGIFTATNWVHVGPFWIQVGRTLHYLVYFLVGAALGAYGNDRGLLSHDGRLARRWPLWLAFAIAAFVFGTVMLLTIVGTLSHGGPSLALSTMGNFSFVLCCAGWSALTLALFLRFGTRSNTAARRSGRERLRDLPVPLRLRDVAAVQPARRQPAGLGEVRDCVWRCGDGQLGPQRARAPHSGSREGDQLKTDGEGKKRVGPGPFLKSKGAWPRIARSVSGSSGGARGRGQRAPCRAGRGSRAPAPAPCHRQGST